jgi:hypothetical protein
MNVHQKNSNQAHYPDVRVLSGFVSCGIFVDATAEQKDRSEEYEPWARESA